MKRFFRVTLRVALCLWAGVAAAQDIVTPSVFLDRVSSNFSEIRDYSADVTISARATRSR